MNEDASKAPWIDPDDAPELDSNWFEEAQLNCGKKVVRIGRPRSEQTKQAISLRLDPEVIAFFKAAGAGWQTRINEALRKVAGI
jgi:uncharacterized protein (DUF4415 family)